MDTVKCCILFFTLNEYNINILYNYADYIYNIKVGDDEMTSNIIDNIVKKLSNDIYAKKEHWLTGEAVTGEVMSKDSTTVVKINGHELSMPSHINVIEEVGDKIKFKISKLNGNTTLQYQPMVKSNDNKLAKSQVKDIFNTSNLSGKGAVGLTKHTNDQETKDDYNHLINTTKRQINNIINKITDQDIKKIIQENYHPEKIVFSTLEKLINNNKLEKDYNVQKIDELVDEEVKKLARTFGSEEEIKSIIKKLKERNLPITHGNIAKVRGVLNKFEEVKNIQDETILNVLRKNYEVTLEKLYEAKYTSGVKRADINYANKSQLTDKEIQSLEPQIIKIMKKENIDKNDTTLRAAKLLVKNDLPIEKRSIDKIVDMNRINKIEQEHIIGQAVDNIIKDKNPTDILFETSDKSLVLKNEQIQETIDQLPKIQDHHIKILIQNQEVINIENLKKELKSTVTPTEIKLNSNQEEVFISSKRQVEEIRLKMTIQSAHKLNTKNININTEPLQKIVEALRQLEKSIYETKESKINGESIDHANKVGEVIKAIESTKSMPMHILGRVMTKAVDFNLQAIMTESLTIQNRENLATYETLGTKPRSDLGDHIHKTFNQLTPILKDLNMHSSDENIRASRILALNELPITKENIQHIKLLDQKVNLVLNELHPTVAANMIKENLSPINMNIDQVIQYMDNFKELMGEDITDKISRYIYQMESDKAISQVEKEGIIGIYRMLNTISRSEGRAVGFLYKNNMALTLDNLMEAAKYLKRTNGKREDINFTIDGDTGLLNHISKNNIKEQIRQALEKANASQTKNNIITIESMSNLDIEITDDNYINIKYLENVLKSFIEKANPNILKKLNDNNRLHNMNLEDLLMEFDNLEASDGIETNTKMIISQIKELQNVKPETIDFMKKYELLLNVRNTIAVNTLLQNNFALSSELDEIIKSLSKYGLDSTSITDRVRGILHRLESGEDISQIGEDIKEEIKELQGDTYLLQPEDKEHLRSKATMINNILDIEKAIQREENFYQLPVMINGQVSQLNMYLIKNQETEDIEEDSLNILLSLKTENIGIVNAYIRTKGNTMHFSIESNTEEGTRYIREHDEGLKSIIKSIGYNLRNLDYMIEKEENILPVQSGLSKENLRKHLVSKYEVSI